MAEKTESSDSDQAKKKLIYSVVILSIAALLLAVFQVLPARFGIDLTGGKGGLTKPLAEEGLRKLSATYGAQPVVQLGVAPILIAVLASDPGEVAVGHAW